MKERPILLSGPMVLAILANRKTQTRRVVKRGKVGRMMAGDQKLWPYIYKPNGGSFTSSPVASPYGMPGDRLWVRETWRPFYDPYLYTSIQYKADGGVVKPTLWDESWGMWCEENTGDVPGEGDDRWHPSIYMPRCFSRITLEVVGVRVERLREITVLDAVREGLESKTSIGPFRAIGWKDYTKGSDRYLLDSRESFQSLWDSINAGRGYSWQSNPWVWVVEFRRVDA